MKIKTDGRCGTAKMEFGVPVSNLVCLQMAKQVPPPLPPKLTGGYMKPCRKVLPLEVIMTIFHIHICSVSDMRGSEMNPTVPRKECYERSV
jgi:hypothetical protein